MREKKEVPIYMGAGFSFLLFPLFFSGETVWIGVVLIRRPSFFLSFFPFFSANRVLKGLGCHPYCAAFFFFWSIVGIDFPPFLVKVVMEIIQSIHPTAEGGAPCCCAVLC